MTFLDQVQMVDDVFIAGDHRVLAVIRAVDVDQGLGLMMFVIFTPQAIYALVGDVAACAEKRGILTGTASDQTEGQ